MAFPLEKGDVPLKIINILLSNRYPIEMSDVLPVSMPFPIEKDDVPLKIINILLLNRYPLEIDGVSDIV